MLKTRFILAVGLILAAANIGHAATVIFQDGLNGYAGTADTFISRSNPTTNYEGDSANNFKFDVTGTNSNLTRFGLIRFDDLFGAGLNQIPVDATITSATLSFYKTGGFGNVWLYNSPVAFNESTATWDSLNAVSFALPAANQLGSADFGGGGGLNTVPRTYDVTTSLNTWLANPATNQGWLMRMSDSNPGATATFRSSNSTATLERPSLSVTFTAAAVPEPSSIAMLGICAAGWVAKRRRRVA